MKSASRFCSTTLLGFGICAAAILLAGAERAQGGMISLVNSRAELGGDDYIDFDPLGETGDTLSNSFFIDSHNGLETRVATGHVDTTLDTLNGYQSIVAEGRYLFRNPFGIARIGAEFDNPVAAVGADFSASLEVGGFDETIRIRVRRVDGYSEIFDLVSTNNPTFSGFAGVRSTEANIRAIEFQAYALIPFSNRYADARIEINRLDLSETVASPGPAVPEPSSIALLGTGLCTLCGCRFRRRRNRTSQEPT